jgi:hypothetical protein
MMVLEPLERLRFFSGRLLSADDLQQEQEYFLARLRRHNRFLHGWGVVSGLGVSLSGKDTLVVQPGLAIDCAGNEIVLSEKSELCVKGMAGKLYLVLKYAEIHIAPTPSFSDPNDSDATEFSRVRESAQVELAAVDPSSNHRGMGRGTPGCGQPHALCLATLSKQGSRWRVIVSRSS